MTIAMMVDNPLGSQAEGALTDPPAQPQFWPVHNCMTQTEGAP